MENTSHINPMTRKLVTNIYRALFAHDYAQKFNRLICDCALHGMGILNYESEKVSGERFLFESILSPIVNRDGVVIFDVGANVGNYSQSLSRYFPRASIHSFEPNLRSFKSLENKKISNCTLVNAGFSDVNGFFDLYDRGDDHGSEHASLHQGVITELHKGATSVVKVKLNTLDEYCNERAIQRIDFIKIDTEGHELQVLKGATKLLAENRIGVMQIEFNEMNVVSRVYCRDFLSLLSSHLLYRLLPSGLTLIEGAPRHVEIFAFQNLVAIPR